MRHTDPLANKVAARYVEAFSSTPLATQVKASLQALLKKAGECRLNIGYFKRAADQVSDYYFDIVEEDLPEAIQKEITPIMNMVRDIANDKVDIDNVDDVLKAGRDIQKRVAPKGSSKEERAQRSLLDIGRDLEEAALELLEKDMPPHDWWSRSIMQTTVVARSLAETAEDKDLTSALEKLARTIDTMYTVGAGLERALDDIETMCKKGLKALEDIPDPAAPDFSSGKPKKKPSGKGKGPKRPTFAEVRKKIFAKLKAEGWKLEDHLKVPHATSPDGRTRLWFKAQAVYVNLRGNGPLTPAHSYSMTSDLRDHADPDSFMVLVKRHSS